MKIAICGSIGAGKSEAFTALQKEFPRSDFFLEPLQEWDDLLDLYYADRKTWALPLSLKVLLSFKTAGACTRPCFVERSPMCCKNVFTKMLHAEGVLSQPAWDVFEDYWNVLGWKPDAVIFIDTPAAICLERTEARGRKGEEAIDIQYLRRVEYYYEKMLKEMEGEMEIRVIRVNGIAQKKVVASDVVRAARDLLQKASLSSKKFPISHV